MAEVVLVRWPEDAPDGIRLAGEGVAVLYLIGADDDAPMATSCLQDWVRFPGDERDLHARVAMLELRAAAHDAPPRVDEHGRLHYHGRLLALSPDEARLAALLVEHFGNVVNDRELGAVVATEPSAASAAPLRAQMTQLRARLRDVGLTLRRSRRRGYQLQHR